MTDALTGLANRRALDGALDDAIRRADLDGAPCAVLFIDIDRFKKINDALGHAAGDVVLKKVGQALGERLRRGDLLTRYGGEEFVAVLPDTGLDAAKRVAETLCERMAALDLSTLTGGRDVRVSIGVAALSREWMDGTDLVAAADAAMYRAKRLGRDQVCVAS